MYIADPRLVPHDVFAYTLHPTRLGMLTEGATPEERTLAGQPRGSFRRSTCLQET
jgi:hypothetical protein